MKTRCRIIAAALLISLLGAGVRAQAEECVVPDHILEISNEIGKEYNICPELLQSIAFQESRFQADAQNGGCTGLMQVNPAWHEDRMRELGRGKRIYFMSNSAGRGSGHTCIFVVLEEWSD